MNDNQHKQLWDKCRQYIKDILPQEQYDVWFKDVESLSYEDNNLTLLVPTPYYAEQLDERFIKPLASSIRRAYGPGTKLFYKFFQVNGDPQTEVKQEGGNQSPAVMKKEAATANPFGPVPQGDIDPQLNPRYTFENYCGGESNKTVRAIAEAIANDPKNLTFIPLFIYGDVGVGKTHLMQAIGIRIKEKNPRARVLYVTARLFESQYRAAVARKADNSFFHFYQSIDTLLIDDIQDLASKPGTQNTFFHIFNHLHQNNKQIIMSSDRAPVDMANFEERLLSRFKWGMVAELERPDLKLRRDILEQKAAQDGLDLPWDVKEYIAANVTGSIRDLEGVMASLIGHATMLNLPITMDLAQSVVGKLIKIDRRPVNFEMIAEKVGTYYDIEPDLLFSKSRRREISDARQVTMYLAKTLAHLQLVDIGRMLQRSHATVNYACNMIEERMSSDPQLHADIQSIQASIFE